MKRSLTLAALLAAFALGGCGTSGDTPLALGLKAVTESLSSDNAPKPVRARMTRAVLDEFGKPLMLAEVEARKAEASLQPLARNGATTTWASGDSRTVSFRGPALVATRGLGEDLMSAEVAGLEAALGPRGGTVRRVHYRLAGDYKTVAVPFRCEVANAGNEVLEIVGNTYSVRHMVETCRPEGSERGFVNEYWVALSDGFVWRSRQWVSPGVGPVLFDRLVR